MAKPTFQIPENLETTFDRIYYSYYSEEVEAQLTQQERLHRERIDEAWHHMVGRKSAISAADHLQVKYDVHRSTAYRIVRDALQLFGDVVKTSRDAKRRLLWEYSLKGLDKAMEIEDMRAYAAILKTMTTFEGLNLDDSTFDGEAIQSHTYHIILQSAGGRELTFNADAIDELPTDQYEEVLNAVEEMTTTAEQMEELLNAADRKGKKKR